MRTRSRQPVRPFLSLSCSLLAAAVATAPSLAQAQKTGSASPAAGAASRSSAQFTLRRDEPGGAAGSAARKHARAGHCALALGLFDAALRVTTEPTLLRDRGLCHETVGSPFPAIDDYRAYLFARPNAPDADVIRARLAGLEESARDGNFAMSGARDVQEPRPTGDSAPLETAAASTVQPVVVSRVGAKAEPVTAADVSSGESPPVASKTSTRRVDDGGESDLDAFKHVSLTLNPLSLLLSRIGMNAEYVITRHHGLSLNPFYQSFTILYTDFSNFGGELGYRYYTGSRGANGFFLGPFITLIAAHTKTVLGGIRPTPLVDESTLIYGVGLDLGGQHVFEGGFTIGGGLGFEYLTSKTTSATESSSTFTAKGIAPRFLFTLGWSF